MSVRDRFDVGEKTTAAEERAQWVREGIMQYTALRTIDRAKAAVRQGTAGPLDRALVDAYTTERYDEGYERP